MEIEKAFKRLLIKSPFYGLFCLSLPKEVTTKIPTLCIVPEGINCKLCINPDFWAKHTDDEQIALLQHELGHICHHHVFLLDSFSDAKIFNLAADAEVNSYIENLPQSAVNANYINQELGTHLSDGQGTKCYYEAIIKALNQNSQSQPSSSIASTSSATQNSSQSSSGQGKDEQPPSPPQESNGENIEENKPEEKQYPDNFRGAKEMDSHDTWKKFKNLPEANKQLIVNTINNHIKQVAEQVEKSCGNIPGEFVELIQKLREKKPEVFNWKAYFRRLLGSIYDVNIRCTRRKESKRFEGASGIQHKKKVSILVAVDTSGSVSTKELQEFFNEIDYVYKAGARVTIIECDTQINSITEYDGKHLPEIKGRGGTEFDPPVDYYIKHKKEYASLIYFTDGEASMPVHKPNGMVWVISSQGRQVNDYPGKTIFIPRNNN